MKATSAPRTPAELIAALPEPRRSEIARLDAFIRKTVPKLVPHVRSGMLGYGPFHYRYESGREGDWFKVGLASRKTGISLYLCAADEGGYVAERYKAKLPKAKIGRSCVAFKKVDDLDLTVLAEMLKVVEKTGFGM